MRFRNDEGATVVIVAFATLLLLGFAALVVDVGMGFNERRQDQTAADVSVMAGALEFAGTVAEIEQQVMDFADANTSGAITAADWAACTDPNQDEFGNFTPLPGGTTPCISASDGTYLRVKLPNQITDTTFGRLLGVNELITSAFAIAEVTPAGGGGILPFAVTSGVGTGGTCLRTGPHAVPPCDGPETGNFREINSPLKGNEEAPYGTTRKCSGDPNGRLQSNIAIGLDHYVAIHGTAELTPDDCDEVLRPNQLYARTGNAPMDEGLISNSTFGAFGTRARLQQGANAKRLISDGTTELWLDNVPLWDYLVGGSGDCASSQFAGAFTEDEKFDNMTACLTSGNPTFSGAIGNSPRLSQVPRFEEPDWPSGTSELRTIAELPPIFLHAVYFNCSGSDPTDCGAIFYPGEATTEICITPPGKCKGLAVEQLTSFVLEPGMLPDGALPDNGPGGSLNISEPLLFR